MTPRCPECGEPLVELYENGEPDPVGVAECAVCAGRTGRAAQKRAIAEANAEGRTSTTTFMEVMDRPAPQDFFTDEHVTRVAKVLRAHLSLDDDEAGAVAFEALKAAFEGHEAPSWASAALQRLSRIRSTREASAEADLKRLRERVQGSGRLWVERGKDVAQSGKAIKDSYTVGEGHAMQRCGALLLRMLEGEDV